MEGPEAAARMAVVLALWVSSNRHTHRLHPPLHASILRPLYRGAQDAEGGDTEI